MGKNFSKQSYFLGISLGICISIFIFISFNIFGKTDMKKNENKIIDENIFLKSQISVLNKEIENLKNKPIKNEEDKKIQTKIVEDKKAIKEDKKAIKEDKIILDIKPNMTNIQISEAIVENGIYAHKNDILLIMEMLSFNRYEYSKVLEKSGYITSAYDLNRSMKEIENNQYAVADALYSKKLVKDKNSFMKLLYILDMRNEIKYGEKEFKKNSSLREVCDVLMN